MRLPPSWTKSRNKRILEEKLKEFADGQFLMEAPGGLVYRGEPCECIVGNKVLVSFKWLAEQKLVSSGGDLELREKKLKWFLLSSPTGVPFLELELEKYYSQPDEDRIKMLDGRGTICHFFKKEDHTNLVRVGDEFIPYCELHKLEFWQILIALLLNKQKKKKRKL